MTTRELLQKALTSLPDDFTFREVKFHVKQALQKMEVVEHKKDKKQESQAKKWDKILKNNVMNPLDYEMTLETLDKMIDTEKTNIKNIQDRKGKKNETLLD